MTDLITPVVLVCNDEYWLPYALEASRGKFSRYVIYDVGSTDETRKVIEWFYDTCSGVQFYVRYLPMVAPSVQGVFRNSMIAEALSHYYFILDGDEVYTSEGYDAIIAGAEQLKAERSKLYGLVRRVEIDTDLRSAYALNGRTPHHRVYHRNAIWVGNHPGEVPYYKQEPAREMWIEGATCYHFHNCERSSKDAEVPKRLERRARATYRPGEKAPFDVLKALPILKDSLAGFSVNPTLAQLQSDSV